MAGATSMDFLLQHAIERHAHADPDRVALRFRGESLTYAGLHGQAASLAGALLDDGLQLGDRVGILARKGLDAAVALYGIMMAGGVYVPLDAFAPVTRNEFVIADCGISRLVSTAQQSKALALLTQSDALSTVFALGDEPDASIEPDMLPEVRVVSSKEVHSFPLEAPRISATELDLCYLLYTSGSTGTPKGIMHTHHSARAWARVTVSCYELTINDVISNYAPLHFDLSTLDYFGGAHAGATTVIIPEEVTKFPADMAQLLAEESLTLFYTVPMALVQLAQLAGFEDLALEQLRLVLFGGEPMPVKHLRTLMRQLPHTTFVNVYGPTETNGCTHYVVPDDLSADVEALPIGSPYPNVAAQVVDPDHAPVERGEPGELLVRAPTLMQGYWGRPDLNETAFTRTDRFGGAEVLFHATGDVVRERDDGVLDFLGRRDRRIKCRGSRVDLDEIEAVLLSHEDVQEAAVYSIVDDDGAHEIYAEVIGDETLTPPLLRQFLRGVVPSYAVPMTVEPRDTFPRTSTGKIDRRSMAIAKAQEKS